MAWHDTSLESGPIPLWFQVANLLRRSIESGEFKPGERLPSEAELNRAFAISRTTARAALDKLEQEGLIARASGRGSIVLDRRIERPVNLFGGFAEDMRRRGLVPSYETITAKLTPAPREVRDALATSATHALQVVRRLDADGIPMALSTSWIAAAMLGGHPPPTRQELNNGSLYQWLESRCGLRITNGYEVIEARVLGKELAHHLGVAPGGAALVATRLSRSASMASIEHAVIVYRADRYRYRLDLS